MFAANSILQWTYPYRASAKQVDGFPKRPYLVFFTAASESETSLFVPKYFNRNSANWETASGVFLNDPGPEERAAWACRFHHEEWAVIGFDENRKESFTEFGDLNSGGRAIDQCPAFP
jgi:hypothetical protein